MTLLTKSEAAEPPRAVSPMSAPVSEKKCHHIRVPPNACILVFSDDRMFYAERLGTSARGEELWAHCDATGRILEIELLGDDKPCQVDDGNRPPLASTGAGQSRP